MQQAMGIDNARYRSCLFHVIKHGLLPPCFVALLGELGVSAPGFAPSPRIGLTSATASGGMPETQISIPQIRLRSFWIWHASASAMRAPTSAPVLKPDLPFRHAL